MLKTVNIGDIIGIYEILGDSVKSQDGHKRLRVKCIVCGLEKDIRPINLGATTCNHKQKIIPKICECCGKPIPYTSDTRAADYKRRRFCSASCAAKFNNKRAHSEESKLKVSNTQLLNRYGDLSEADLVLIKEARTLAVSKRTSAKYYTEGLIESVDYVVCPYCGLRFSQIQKSHLKLHNKSLDDLFNDFGKEYKLVSDKTFNKRVKAGKEVQQRLLNTGRHKGWQSRNIMSYAEAFWIEVLNNNHIEYKREVPVWNGSANYFLDFVLEYNGKLIDLEIDGKQHTYIDRCESDKVRDLYLTKQGYLIYRIPWNEITSEIGKEQMSQKIHDFLEFYKNI